MGGIQLGEECAGEDLLIELHLVVIGGDKGRAPHLGRVGAGGRGWSSGLGFGVRVWGWAGVRGRGLGLGLGLGLGRKLG